MKEEALVILNLSTTQITKFGLLEIVGTEPNHTSINEFHMLNLLFHLPISPN